MPITAKRTSLALLIIGGLLLLLSAALWTPAAQGQPLRQENADLVAQGEYIANITRCISCHTPQKEEYTAETLTEEQTRTLALFPREALNTDLWMAGGTVYNFGPSGSVTASNITPDEETGIGRWTDEELKNTLITGVRPDGRRMHTIMPTLQRMADSDVDAVIAYLRSLEPIRNEIVNTLEVTTPPAEPPAEPIIAPDPADQSARGEYLVTITNCSGCHTPTDPETRRPIMEKFLAGRDPFERDYGTVYAGNITPHEETGIGTWTDEQIARALVEGVRIDGRRLSLMPWQDLSVLTEADTAAMVHYLTNDVTPVENSIPATDLAEPYRVFVGDEASAAEEEESNTALLVGAGVGLVIVLAVGIFLLTRRKASPAA